jgi:hypothetical protein
MKRWLHWLAHKTGWNMGMPETWWGDDGMLWVGFRCHGCGQLQDQQWSYGPVGRPLVEAKLEERRRKEAAR